jgi:hypothetical protein
MGRIEKTVFISYRRTNLPWARAIYQDLTMHGFDAFFDFQSIDSGDFSQLILENIKARAHFVLLLTPSALERCDDPNDWLRREIETAIDIKRNVVPLMLESFDFGSSSTTKYLTGKLALLKSYNGLRIHSDYFDEGMARLRNRYLNIPLDAVLHPVSNIVRQETQKQQEIANSKPAVKQRELTAQEWFESGYKAIDFDEKNRFYTEAIRLKPDYADAYINRGIARRNKDDLNGAIKDFTEAIRLEPNEAESFHDRAYARRLKGDLVGAINDYTQGLILNPKNVDIRIGLMGTFKILGRHAEADQQMQLIRPLLQKATKYNQACFETLCGNTNRAIVLLKKAIEENPNRAALARKDTDFENIRNDLSFKELVGE